MDTSTSHDRRIDALPTEYDLEFARIASGMCVRWSNRKLAAAAGISERHFYRLKKGGKAKSAGAQRLYAQMVGDALVAELLVRLGHSELIGTEAHDFLDRFMRTLTRRVAELQANEPGTLRVGYAEQAAVHSIERLRRLRLSDREIELRLGR